MNPNGHLFSPNMIVDLVSGPYWYSSVEKICINLNHNKLLIGCSVVNDVIIIRLSFSKADTRLFYLFNNCQSIWCSAQDRHLFASSPALQVLIGRLTNDGLNLQIAQSLEGPIQKLMSSNTYASATTQYISRGPYSSHFGHFIHDIIPVLNLLRCNKLDTYLYDRCLLTQPLANWNREISEFIGFKGAEIDDLVSYPFVNSFMLKQVDGIQISLSKMDLSFVSMSRHTGDVLLKESIRCQSKFRSNLAGKKPRVLILGRSLSGSSPRWSNYHDCIHSANVDYRIILPEELGPSRLEKHINSVNYSAILVPIGSSSFQLFMMNINCPIVVLRGSFNCDGTWASALRRDYIDSLYEMSPFLGHFWLAYRDSAETQPWNESFKYANSEVDSIVNYVLGNPCSTALNTGIKVLSPSA
jgi:hypothetical protein